MSTSDLSDAEIETLHAALRALEAELRALLESESSRSGAQPVDLDDAIGRVSRIDAIQQQQMLQANRAGMQQRLQAVRAALGRVADGSYGECRSCGEGVGFSRLEARPESPLCLACQNRREARG